MFYQEIKALVMSITNLLVAAAYCIYAFGRAGSGLDISGELKSWAVTILVFIGAGIGAAIVIQILFHILLSIGIAVREKLSDRSITGSELEKRIEAETGAPEDERDKLIELKAGRIGQILAGAGFVTALIYSALGYPAALMLNIMFISFCAGAAAEGFCKVYFYRKGVKNG